MTECWNRCDECGRFIAYLDFESGARRTLQTPDSEFTREEYETLCKGCDTPLPKVSDETHQRLLGLGISKAMGK